jgi:hypothetical protein
VAPLSLSFDHSYNQVPAAVDLADPLGWLGLAAAGALIAAAAVALRRKSAVPLVVIAGFAASYALFSNTAFLIVTIFAERLFLAPSWWLCLGAVVAARWLLAREPSVRPALVALCAVVVVSQVALAALRSREIGSSADLLAAQVDTAPDSVKGHLYYARELASQRQAEEAVWQVAIAYAGQRAFPRPWRAPRDVDRLPVRERLARLPQLVAPDMAPRDYWSLLRPVARRFVGRQSLPIIDDLAGRSRE